MALAETIQKKLEGHIADILLIAGLGAVAALISVADYLLPETAIQSLGSLLSAQILLGLSLTVALLVAWVVYLRVREPKLRITTRPSNKDYGVAEI